MATNQRVGIIAKYAQGIMGKPPITGVGSLPTLGSLPSLPTLGSLPSLPSLGSLPSLPTLGSLPSFGSLGSASTPTTTSSGGYALEFLFYFFLYGFTIFLLLLLVHFTVRPIFQVVPGGKGILPIPTTSDYSLYWAKGIQPTTPAPDRTVVGDSLISYPFVKVYTVSADICLTSLAGHSGLDRLIFYCSSDSSFSLDTFSLTPNLSLSEQFATKVNGVSMICYVADDTNDLIVTYFMKSASDGSIVQRSSFPIQNIPLYTPFRVTIVYDKNMITVYFNGVQVSQTTLANTNPRNEARHAFYANTLSSKCGYVQTLLLWNRPLLYSEITGNTVALTPIAKFNMPPKTASVQGGSCS
jgi:hypothetical protein